MDELADERLTVAVPGKALQKYSGGGLGTHCPPSMNEMRFLEKPPEGEFSWKGHRNLDTLPKLLQQVVRLCTMSSVQITPSVPSSCGTDSELEWCCEVRAAVHLLDDGVVGDGNALLLDVGEAALVHQLAHGLQVRSAVCDVAALDVTYIQRGNDGTHVLTERSMLRVALLKRRKTPLLIWRKRKSWRILRVLGSTPLILQRWRQRERNEGGSGRA